MPEGDGPSDRSGARGPLPQATAPAADLEPTEYELRLFARIVLHLGREGPRASGGSAPETLTQAGIASSLGTSQANTSYALRRLIDGGAVRGEREHVHGRRQRVLVYRLTEEGAALARHIREGLGR